MILNVVGNVEVGASDGEEGDDLQDEDAEGDRLHGKEPEDDEKNCQDYHGNDGAYFLCFHKTSLFVYQVDMGVVGVVLAAAQPLLTERDERPGEAGHDGDGAVSSEKSSSKRR